MQRPMQRINKSSGTAANGLHDPLHSNTQSQKRSGRRRAQTRPLDLAHGSGLQRSVWRVGRIRCKSPTFRSPDLCHDRWSSPADTR